jgi:beta-lactamase class A
VKEGVAAQFAAARVHGSLYALDLDSGREVAHLADQPVVLASVSKTAVLVELYRRAAAGDLDLAERRRVPGAARTLGPTGLSAMRDAAELSLRDLALLMITISDNAATDCLMARLGPERIQATVEQLGLEETDVRWTCREILGVLREDMGLSEEAFADPATELTWAMLERNRALDPRLAGNRSTPRQWAKLLRAIWLDEAAPAPACAEMRAVLRAQFAPHRLATGFPDGVAIGAKTGTLTGGLRNEAGVVEFPDGGRYAVCVFTRAFDWKSRRLPAADRVIGTAARLAVEELRA